MKFTIGSISNFQEYENDLKLIKSSLLYADEIELIGLTEYYVFKCIPEIFENCGDLDSFISTLTTLLSSVNFPKKEETLQELRAAQEMLKHIAPIMRKKKRRTPAEIQLQASLRLKTQELQEQMTIQMQELVDRPSSKELKSLVERNIISIYDYDLKEFNIEKMAGGFFANLLNAIYSSNTFPLFDDVTNSIVGQIMKNDSIVISSLDAEVLRHAGVATNILMTLPTLEGASYDELLDLKKQNAGPLSRFREAVYGFSESISSLPWDKEFQYECLKLYETKVVPRVEEINELFTETSTLKNFGKKVLADEEIRKKAGFIAGGLTTAITTSSNMTEWWQRILVMAATAALSGEAASVFLKVLNYGIQAHEEMKSVKSKGIGNVMYYYYLASKQK